MPAGADAAADFKLGQLLLEFRHLSRVLFQGRQVLGTRSFERRKLVRQVLVLRLVEDGK